MTKHERFAPRDGAACNTAAEERCSHLHRLGRRATDWFKTCADYYAAAAMYEDLARLSDAELARRGLRRATLAQDLCQARERH